MAVIERKFGFPMVLGCIDGTYIPIQQPTENASDYYCYKMKHSLNVQATCNKNGLFIDVDVLWPDSVHGARVYAKPSLN